MPIQDFNIYTANGYEGDLVDSGPRTVQTGILTSTSVGFGKALQRDASIPRGVQTGATANVYAISQREYNHEASTRPSDGNDFNYLKDESVSIIRQGYLYIKLTGATAITAGQVLHVDQTTGFFTKDAVAGDVIACTNVVADESAIVGDVFKARIDIVA